MGSESTRWRGSLLVALGRRQEEINVRMRSVSCREGTVSKHHPDMDAITNISDTIEYTVNESSVKITADRLAAKNTSSSWLPLMICISRDCSSLSKLNGYSSFRIITNKCVYKAL